MNRLTIAKQVDSYISYFNRQATRIQADIKLGRLGLAQFYLSQIVRRNTQSYSSAYFSIKM